MKRLLLTALTIAFVACNVTKPAPTSPSSASLEQTTAIRGDGSTGSARGPQFAVELFVDYGVPAGVSPAATATTETDSYSLIQGGIRWASSSDTVNYSITGSAPVGGANTAVTTGVATIDGYVTTRSFAVGSASENPCGGTDLIQWTSIDGPGNILASTSTCRNVATKEIVGFVITIDRDETWSTNGAAGTFDVQEIITHEMGHAAGLGHDSAPRDGCLTMYKFASPGETQKRTLGLGDKLGMDVLYNTGDTSAGPGCGS
jgi:hypothetical protein